MGFPRGCEVAEQRVAGWLYTSFAVLLPVGVLATGLGIPMSHEVRISADGTTRNQRVFARNVGDVLTASKLALRPGDRLTPSADTPVRSGMTIEVIRTVPIELRIGGVTAR